MTRRSRSTTGWTVAAALGLLASMTASATGGPTPIEAESLKFTAPDGGFNDRFGFSVAVSGTTAIVGSSLDDDRGFDSGSASLVDLVTGRRIALLLPDENSPNASFGTSVAIDRGFAIVGAPGDTTNGNGAGAAYLFDAVTGARLAKLLAADGGPQDLFGLSVGISGNTAIVGAYLDDDRGLEAGAAYLFDVPSGVQVAKLLAADGAAGDRLGIAVAIDGTLAIAGSFLDDDNGLDSGSAYVFDARTGVQLAKLRAPDGAADDFFGVSVAIDGTTALVGATQDDDDGPESGSAYLLDALTGQLLAKLRPGDGTPFKSFGAAVALDGGTAIVGAPLDDTNGLNAGAAYRFDVATGVELAKLLPSDGAALDSFGISVAVAGPTVVVGSSLDDDGATNAGSAYRFGPVAGSCPADLDGSGAVGLDDLVALLSAWGGPDADLDGDGVTGIADLLALVAAWGPCR